MHRDVKLENVLMQSAETNDLTIRIADFGFAKFVNPNEGLTEVLGSPLYMAPEILLKKPYGTGVDIWAAGVLLHILITGNPPFIAETKKEIFEMIKKNEVKLTDKHWDRVSPQCKNIVYKMLQRDHQTRPTAAQLLKHSWFDIIRVQNLNNKQDLRNIAKNLRRYRHASEFQKSMSLFISNLQTESTQLNDLRQLFLLIDTNRDGKLTALELQTAI